MQQISHFLFQPQHNNLPKDILLQLFNQNFTISYTFFYFEFKTAFYCNLFFSVPFLLIITIFESTSKPGFFEYLWTNLFCICNLFNFLAKLIILIKINQSQQIDRKFIHLLFKSRIYHYNNLIGRILLFLYSILFFKIIIIQILQTSDLLQKLSNSTVDLEIATYLIMIQFMARSKLSFKHLQQTTDKIFKTKQDSSQIQKQIDDLATFNIDNTNYQNMKNSECAICLQNYELDQNVKQLGCYGKHIFHQECIDSWLVKNLKCPCCQCMSI